MSEADFIPFDGGSSPAKDKKERKERINTTLFVSSLPFTATTTDLLTHFSYIGPVRHGFVATDKASGKSKGVGYVTYSLKEDAEQAVSELDGSEFGDKGRKIRVAWANERPELKERKAAANAVDDEPKPSKGKAKAVEPSGDADPNAIRTLVLTGLPGDLTKNVLWKKVRKISDKVELIYPVEGSDNTAHLVFPSHGDALKAIPKLHGHTYKGSLLSCVLKKRLEKLSSKSHAGRLIVRNLAWDTTEQDLRATFLPYGPIHSIDLPTLPSKLPAEPDKPAPPPRARGFAFVWFLARADAEKAIEGVNGKVIAKAGGADGKDQSKGKAKEGRAVAVDWALSKEKWEETQKGQPSGKTVEEGDGEGSSSGSSSDAEGSGSGSDEDEEDSEEEEAEGDEDNDEDDESGDEGMDVDEPVKPALPQVDVGSTLFVRNLPFEATEQELNTLFRSFGPLRYARITVDKLTGRSRGTGFVCFWKTEHADAALEEAERVAKETGTNAIPLGTNKNPFALPSLLTADPSSSLASRLVLHGRSLEVSRAVTREQAGQMKEDGERARHSSDKRNTYLMREGVIFPNSPAAAAMPEAEVEKRQSSFNARKALLRSNPSLYISKTRLSIRQLPLFASDRTLKRLAIHAVRAFNDEVTAGEREPLSRAEEVDETLSPALEARKDQKKGKGKKERDTPVIQSKIVRQLDKLDPVAGQGRSKGYGFLEMRSHKDALKVLRWANNNPAVGKLMAGWWKVELEDMYERAKKALEGARKGGAAPPDEADGQKGKKPKESVEDLERRVKLLGERVKEPESGGMRGGKTLMIEFSIENVQVVKRRVEKIGVARDEARSEGRGVKRSREDGESAARSKWPRADRPPRGDRDGGEKGRPTRQKRDRDGPRADKRAVQGGKGKEGGAAGEPAEKKGLEKLGAHLGSLIGRKRRQRAGK